MSDFRREREAIRWMVDEELYKFLLTIKACIAGGCITSIFSGTPVVDIDIFFRTPEDYVKAKNYFLACEKSKYRGTQSIYETERAKTFSMEHNKKYNPDVCGYGMSFHRRDADNKEVIIQIVNSDVNYGSPEEIISNFDLTVCQAAFDFNTEQFVIGSRFLQDIARKRIVINPDCKNIVGGFFRIQKYIEKGYTVSPREYLKLAFMLYAKKYKTYRNFIDDLKICFNDPLVHHFYNKVRFPMGVRCEEKNSLLDNPFYPEVIVEWIEEFNVAGPHYPVKEGKDMSDIKTPEIGTPMYDTSGNVVDRKKTFLDDLFTEPQAIAFSHAPGPAPKPVAFSPKKVDYDDDDDDDINFDDDDGKI